MPRIVPNLRSPTYGQLCVRSPGVRYLFGLMHSLRDRMRETRRQNDAEMCSSVPSMCSHVRGGRTRGSNSAGCSIKCDHCIDRLITDRGSKSAPRHEGSGERIVSFMFLNFLSELNDVTT